MKMKRLTALVLAGVLCLGMSTTAFAAESVRPVDGENTIKNAGDAKLYKVDENGKIVKDENGNPIILKEEDIEVAVDTLDTGKYADKYDTEDDKKFSGQYNLWTADSKEMPGVASEAMRKAIGEDRVDKNAQVVFLDAADVTSNVHMQSFADQTNDKGVLTLKFDLSDYKIKDKYGIETPLNENTDHVYVMHFSAVTQTWMCLDATLKEERDGDILKRFAYVDFDAANGLSPVVFMATRSNVNGGQGGGNQGDNGNINTTPGDGTTLTPGDVTPGTDGKVTIDDIANAVVKKLQASNVKAVRTSSGVSPKTGE